MAPTTEWPSVAQKMRGKSIPSGCMSGTLQLGLLLQMFWRSWRVAIGVFLWERCSSHDSQMVVKIKVSGWSGTIFSYEKGSNIRRGRKRACIFNLICVTNGVQVRLFISFLMKLHLSELHVLSERSISLLGVVCSRGLLLVRQWFLWR